MTSATKQHKKSSFKASKKSIIALLLTLTVIVTCAFAFLTATDSKENVFVVGNVNIELQEDGWEADANGQYKKADNTNFNMEPGATINKAPKIENTGTNNAWVYMTVGVPYEKASNIYEIDGHTNFTEDALTIKVEGYAIQEYYKDLDTAADVWNTYFPEHKESHFGTEYPQNKAKTLIELFTLNDMSENWELIDDPYISTDGHVYYVYSYGLLTENQTTTSLFESVTLLDSIGNPANAQVTFAGYYNANNEFCEEEKTLTWDEIVEGVDAEKYRYGDYSYVQTHAQEFGLLDSLDSLGLTADNQVTLNSEISYNKIGYGAFYNTTIESITIPSGVKTIGLEAFAACDMLSEVNMPDSVSVISAGAFGTDTALTSIKLSNNLQTIEPMAFFLCENLRNVTFGNNVTDIKDMAFYGCNIDSLKLPKSLEKVGPLAFSQNPINNIDFNNCTLKQVDFYAFVPDDNCMATRNYTLPSNLPTQSISLYAFTVNTATQMNGMSLSFAERCTDYTNKQAASVFFDDTNEMEAYFQRLGGITDIM